MAKKNKSNIVFESTFSSYTVIEIIGEGGTSLIYKCIDDSANQCAVKLLKPQSVSREKIKRFKNELTFCLRNKHANIVTVTDHGRFDADEGASPFYVMPLYASSLRKLMKSGIAPEKALPYFAQILDGIEAAHLQGVVHRDIKPENILYDPATDRLLICDFGIASFEEEELYTAVETKHAARLANFQYSAPEQRSRGGSSDVRTDIYALGLILNEIFTNEVPQGTEYKTIATIAPQYAYLDDLVFQMIRQTPNDRPTAISIVKDDLIGRRNEFVTQQRLSELRGAVVPTSDIDDPLIVDPPKLVRIDFNRGVLTIFLSRPIPPPWISAFQNMGSFGFSSVSHPSQVSISGDKATIQTSEQYVQHVVDNFKSWLPIANLKYQEMITGQKRAEDERKRKELQQEIDAQEQRLRVLRSVKI